MMRMNRYRISLLISAMVSFDAANSLRNIVFIAADDLGWNDIGFHNSEMITPNLDKLASEGVILNSSYVQPTCTPSRHSFMTGIYPFKVGIQRAGIVPFQAKCSPTNIEFFPKRLKNLGYATHMVGKWHLGFCNWNCTPTYRGFDSFLGFYNGKEDYYTKELFNGKDFRDGENPIMNKAYSTEIYSARTVDIIREHNTTDPLFLYLSFQAVHSPIQVPEKYENMYPNIQNKQRRQYCGMVSAMDEAVGNVTDALQNAGLMNDTLIIFTSDNGGMPSDGGNNYPLRGAKTTIFEGGTRAVAFLYGSGLENTGYTYDGLIHAVDWHPTIVAAAGGNTTIEMDGINQWDAIRQGDISRRSEFVYNLDDKLMAANGNAAIRVGDYKLIQGYPGAYPDWYKPENQSKADTVATHEGEPFKGEGLYNLRDDPYERNDISKELPDIVNQLKVKLDEYRMSLVPPKNLTVDPASDPSNYGGYWSPGWC